MSGRLPGVEGLRAVAACAVLLHHAPMIARTDNTQLSAPVNEVFADLRWGLLLFFALSGFLLFRPFAAAILHGGPLPSVRVYARHRAARILPAYWVILLLVAFVLGTAAVWSGDGFGAPTFGVLVADLLLVQNYSTDTVFTGIGPAWSLGVELAFYAILPLIAVAAARLAARRSPLLAAAGAGLLLVTIGVISKLALAAGAAPASWGMVTQTLLPVHADLFGLGMLAAVVHVLHADGRVRLSRRALLGAAAGLVAFAMLGSARLHIEGSAHLEDTIVGAACALLLLAVCAKGAGSAVLERKPVVGLGLISYSVYLWHVPLLVWLKQQGFVVSGERSLAVVLVLSFAATLALSLATYLLVERPAQRAAKRTTPSDSSSETAPSIASRSRWPRTSLSVR